MQRPGALTALRKSPTLAPAAAGLGALLLALSDFLIVIRVDVAAASCSDLAGPQLADRCLASGGERHGHAFLILGLLTLALAYGAGVARSRPAALALLLIGATTLVISVAGDLPDIHATGQIGPRLAEAETEPGAGLWVELAGSLLTLLGGALALAQAGTRSGASARRAGGRGR
ncbi:MAG: hypothetical protein IRZ21_10105 [Thermoleophilaceae bacterium]|nr:hypothetical protein [Thermoleophilaceae bacterium]